jgi:hypothetical protein
MWGFWCSVVKIVQYFQELSETENLCSMITLTKQSAHPEQASWIWGMSLLPNLSAGYCRSYTNLGQLWLIPSWTSYRPCCKIRVVFELSKDSSGVAVWETYDPLSLHTLSILNNTCCFWRSLDIWLSLLWKIRNSVYWLMDDIDLHPLPGADEVSADVVVAGQ